MVVWWCVWCGDVLNVSAQVPRDLLKALPVLAVFAVPFAGNLAPVVGFLYPKALLPTQFWSSSQRHHYMLQVRK